MKLQDNPAVLVIIPARGGSKGILEKNLQKIGGVSLIERSIWAAQNAKLPTMIAVSTDDERIASISISNKVIVIDRPDKISGDNASSESALIHAADTVYNLTGKKPEIVVLLQCTSPFTIPDFIDGTIKPVLDGESDSVFTVARNHSFLWQYDQDGKLQGLNHRGQQRTRRQDLEPQFLETGSVYAMRYTKFIEEGHRFCGKTDIYEIDEKRAMEIDTPADLEKARLLAYNLDTYPLRKLPNTIKAVVCDFDGVFTNNKVFLNEEGIESVSLSRSDGMGIELVRQKGIQVYVISKERNPVVAARCKKLKLPFVQGIDDKLTILKKWLSDHDYQREEIIYIGNDVNDIQCLKYAGCAVGPSDSHPDVLPFLNIQLQNRGGNGAIRELCDLILKRYAKK